jgi:putative membrane protein
MAPTANELAQERTDMAATRTLMAADRTLMAWIRTALSLLSFGFTIYKILGAVQDAGRTLPNEHTPRNAGLFLAAMGTLAMVMGTIEYLQTRKALRSAMSISLLRPSFVMAVIMSVSGAVLFFGIVMGIL